MASETTELDSGNCLTAPTPRPGGLVSGTACQRSPRLLRGSAGACPVLSQGRHPSCAASSWPCDRDHGEQVVQAFEILGVAGVKGEPVRDGHAGDHQVCCSGAGFAS